MGFESRKETPELYQKSSYFACVEWRVECVECVVVVGREAGIGRCVTVIILTTVAYVIFTIVMNTMLIAVVE